MDTAYYQTVVILQIHQRMSQGLCGARPLWVMKLCAGVGRLWPPVGSVRDMAGSESVPCNTWVPTTGWLPQAPGTRVGGQPEVERKGHLSGWGFL